MSKYDELKRLAEAVREDNETYGDADMYEPSIGLSQAETKFAKCANPAAILELIAENERLREQCNLNDLVHGTKGRERVAALLAENGRMADQVSALEEKVAELNFDAARYCYLATTTWSDDVTDALCTSDKDQIDQAIDAELMRASA